MVTARCHRTVAYRFYAASLGVGVLSLIDSIIILVCAPVVPLWSGLVLAIVSGLLWSLGNRWYRKASFVVDQRIQARFTWLEGGRKP
jgi:glucose uptake protein GlcU